MSSTRRSEADAALAPGVERAPERLSRADEVARRTAIVAYAKAFVGETNQAIVDRVAAEIAAGRLPGPVPNLATIWTWLKPFRRQKRSDALAALAEAGGRTESAPTCLADVPSLARDATHAALIAQVATLAALAEAHKVRLAKAHAFSKEYVRRHKQELKWTDNALKAEGSRRPPWLDSALRIRITALRSLVADYETTLRAVAGLNAGGGATAGAPSQTTQLAVTPSNAARTSQATAIAVTPAASSAASAVSPKDPDWLPLYRTDDGTQEPWVAELDRSDPGTLGGVLGYVAARKAREDAQARLDLLAPVLNGAMGCDDCAAAWRAVFAGARDTEAAIWLSPPGEEYQIKYRAISGDTLRSWRTKVLRAREEAAALGQRASDVTALMHTRHDLRRVRVGTREQREEAIKKFKKNPDFSAALVCEQLQRMYGVEVSERTIQREIARGLGDVDRIEARGGPAGKDQIFRFRLIRECPYPNRAWIMDHSFFKLEVRDPAHPEWLDGIASGSRDLDFEFECARLVESVGRPARRKRVVKLAMTVIVDACTRRVLAVRLWDGVPSAQDTLLALRDAMERFGTPEILYTDNGTDLTAKVVRDALRLAGVHHVRSMPYCPEGRGKIERLMRTIKEHILVTLSGYHGKHGPAPDDELLLLEDVERIIMARVDEALNGKRHTESGRIPTEHYNELIGARGLLGQPAVVDALIPLLSVRESARVGPDGTHGNGKRYAGPGLMGVPIGATVHLFSDPYRPRLAFVGVPDANGALRNNGQVKVYGASDPAPDFVEWNELTKRWRDEREGLRGDVAERNRARGREERRRLAETDAAQLAAAVGAQIRQLTAGTAATGDAPAVGDALTSADGTWPEDVHHSNALPLLTPHQPSSISSENPADAVLTAAEPHDGARETEGVSATSMAVSAGPDSLEAAPKDAPQDDRTAGSASAPVPVGLVTVSGSSSRARRDPNASRGKPTVLVSPF